MQALLRHIESELVDDKTMTSMKALMHIFYRMT